MKTSVGNITKAQIELLLRIPDSGTLYVVDYYKPAPALISLGLAQWERQSQIKLTEEGVKMKRTFAKST